MTYDDAHAYVVDLYTHLLRRAPGEAELNGWVNEAMACNKPEDIFRAFIKSPEYRGRHEVKSMFPPGHYHSPVVDPKSIVPYYEWSRSQMAGELAGIDVDANPMLAFWDGMLDVIRTTMFGAVRSPGRRFFYDGSPYPWGDAIMLRAMIAHYRPRRIIEIGSGFSTACMLDSADEFRHHELQITCIEPYPDRLRSLLFAEDKERVDLLELPVQDVPLDRFDALGPADILFVDSTHVLKTGSDVHFELFHILPRLKSGVLVHIHDCPFPFEYPPEWVLEQNFSWNEAYAVRAFLSFNRKFSILFWNSYLAKIAREKLMRDYRDFLRNAGTSIWLIAN